MLIRPAGDADRPAICRVHQAAARQLAARVYSAEQIESWVGALTPDSYSGAIRTHALIVAEDERGVIAFGQLDPARGEIDAVYVLPSAAGQGIGSAVLLALEQTARNCGALNLHLIATLNAVAFYERAGYTRECDTAYHTAAGSPLPVVSMSKRLRVRGPEGGARAMA